MSDTPNPDTPPPSKPSGPTWFRWPGVEVYGANDGARPPDYERPWDFKPPPTAPLAPQPQPMPDASQMAPPQLLAPPPPPTQPQAFAPPLPQAAPEFPLPSPVGPAMTPDERAEQLGLNPNQGPPSSQ